MINKNIGGKKMKTLEGIAVSEIKESELEKKSITVTDEYNFDDCALTEKDKLQQLKDNLQEARLSRNDDQEIIEDFEDCKKNTR